MGPLRSSAQGTITLKMQSGIPPKDIFHEQFVQLGKKIERCPPGASASTCCRSAP
jgi:hypothetical protein